MFSLFPDYFIFLHLKRSGAVSLNISRIFIRLMKQLRSLSISGNAVFQILFFWFHHYITALLVGTN